MVGEPEAFPPEDDQVVGLIPRLDRLPPGSPADHSALSHALRDYVDWITGTAAEDASMFNNFVSHT